MSLLSLLRARTRRPDPALVCDVWSAQLEMLRSARREHRSGAARAQTIAGRLGGAPTARELLRESMQLLMAAPSADDYEVLLDAWLEIQMARASVSRRERPVLRCVRDAAIAFQRGASPEQAMQVGWRHVPRGLSPRPNKPGIEAPAFGT